MTFLMQHLLYFIFPENIRKIYPLNKFYILKEEMLQGFDLQHCGNCCGLSNFTWVVEENQLYNQSGLRKVNLTLMFWPFWP